MRRCLTGDLVAAAAVVCAVDAQQQSGLAQSLIVEADAAHRYSKRMGRAHPLWGNGSLMSRALLMPPQRSVSPQSPEYLLSLALVARMVAKRKAMLAAISRPI